MGHDSVQVADRLTRRVRDLEHEANITLWLWRFLSGDENLGIWPELNRAHELASFLKSEMAPSVSRRLSEAVVELLADVARRWRTIEASLRERNEPSMPYIELVETARRAAILGAAEHILEIAQWDTSPPDPLLHLELLRAISALKPVSRESVLIRDALDAQNGPLYAPLCISALLVTAPRDAFMLLPHSYCYWRDGQQLLTYENLCMQVADRLGMDEVVRSLDAFWASARLDETSKTDAAMLFYAQLLDDPIRSPQFADAVRTVYGMQCLERSLDDPSRMVVRMTVGEHQLEHPLRSMVLDSHINDDKERQRIMEKTTEDLGRDVKATAQRVRTSQNGV